MEFAKFHPEDPYRPGKLPAAMPRLISLLADESPAELRENMRSTVRRGVRTRKTVAARRYNQSPLRIGE